MDTWRRRTTAVAAATLMAVGGLVLAGCSGSDGDATIITDDGTVSVQQDDEKIEVTTSEGSVTINGESDGELPAGWPAEVPVPAGGQVQVGVVLDGTGEQGWTATIFYPDTSAAQVAAEVTSLLVGQGFEATVTSTTGAGGMSAFEGPGYAVTTLVSEVDSGVSLVMSVVAEG